MEFVNPLCSQLAPVSCKFCNICLIRSVSRSSSTSSTASPRFSSSTPSSFWLRAFTPPAPSRRSCRATSRPPCADAASLLSYVQHPSSCSQSVLQIQIRFKASKPVIMMLATKLSTQTLKNPTGGLEGNSGTVSSLMTLIAIDVQSSSYKHVFQTGICGFKVGTKFFCCCCFLGG